MRRFVLLWCICCVGKGIRVVCEVVRSDISALPNVSKNMSGCSATQHRYFHLSVFIVLALVVFEMVPQLIRQKPMIFPLWCSVMVAFFLVHLVWYGVSDWLTYLTGR